jgi:hypothetical protein
MKAAQSAAGVRGRQPVFAHGMADRHDALDVTSVQTQTDDSLNRLWPGLARPSTTRGTYLAGSVDARHKAGHERLRLD